MRIELNDDQYDASKLSFAAIENTLINIDSGSEVYDGMRAPFFLNQQLVDAIKANASDIHFEPYSDSLCVRFRVDGVMQEVVSLPKEFGHLVTTRLKVISGLDISEHSIGRSGRFKMSLGQDSKKGVDFRCSVIPTLYGETLNLRVLYLPEEKMGLGTLGFEEHQIEPVLYHANRLQGLVLITGPTGAGKTVTLYTLLKHMNNRTSSIFTVEDPVEIELRGINQIGVTAENSVGDITRALLRQDPDVIMLGEIRDRETCEVAVRAANTGHLVLSTVHSNGATKSISRLVGLGLERQELASVLSLVVSQRLLRRLDPRSRVETTVDRDRLLALGFVDEELDGLKLYRAAPDAHSTGYRGRTGVFQVVPVNSEVAGMIAGAATEDEIERYVEQRGLHDMRRSALEKVKQGITDVDEVERIFGYVDGYDFNGKALSGAHHQVREIAA
ncbi:MAG: ATPase, T2SS/T4P/T4SS family [Pseudomonadota bacterium]